MKNYFLIFLLTLIFGDYAKAELSTRNLNCSGQSKTIRYGGTDIDSFYEDFKVYIENEKIIAIETIDTNHRLMRDTVYGGNNFSSTNEKIKIRSERNKIDDMTIDTFEGTISLSSGRYNGYWKGSSGNFDFAITWDAVCKGFKELYSYINSIDEGLEDIENNKLYASSSGTGFFISKNGKLVTNHHVIEGCKDIKVFYNDNSYLANVLAVDKMNDLAILEIKKNVDTYYMVANEDPELLENVIIAGFPLGKNVSSAIKTSKGSITALAGYGDNYSEFQTDAALNSGNSGGPIINEDGEVVGVAVAAYGKQAGIESFNFGIKNSTLKTFAKANKIKLETPSTFSFFNPNLSKLINEGTTYIECWMTGKDLKRMVKKQNSRKAFFSEYIK